jgi:hypothetical protein
MVLANPRDVWYRFASGCEYCRVTTKFVRMCNFFVH